MNPTLPNINRSTKSVDLTQNTDPLFNNPLTSPKLPRIQIFKTDFRKLSILSKSWESLGILGISRGWGGGGVSSCLGHYDTLRTKLISDSL